MGPEGFAPSPPRLRAGCSAVELRTCAVRQPIRDLHPVFWHEKPISYCMEEWATNEQGTGGICTLNPPGKNRVLYC